MKIEGGFLIGPHLLYALDNAHRKVYLYRLNEKGDGDGAVPVAAEMTFQQFLRFDDDPSDSSSVWEGKEIEVPR